MLGDFWEQKFDQEGGGFLLTATDDDASAIDNDAGLDS